MPTYAARYPRTFHKTGQYYSILQYNSTPLVSNDLGRKDAGD